MHHKPMLWQATVIVALGLAGLSLATCKGRPPAVRPLGRYLFLNGIRMYFEDQGEGPPLILLHGGAGNGKQFERQVLAFTPRFRVIVPDACGQGRTTDRADSLTYHAMAEDVVALMDSLSLARADLMGWSDGGVVALDVAMHHADRVDRVVTLGANFRADGLNAADQAWCDTARAASFGSEMRRAYEQLAPDPSHYEAAMTKIVALWRTQPNYSLEELGAIRARVLVIAGERDVVRPEHTKALAQAIPGAELWIVPGASHSVMQEKPELVNARVLQFLLR